jgi:hypothetical protein
LDIINIQRDQADRDGTVPFDGGISLLPAAGTAYGAGRYISLSGKDADR